MASRASPGRPAGRLPQGPSGIGVAGIVTAPAAGAPETPPQWWRRPRPRRPGAAADPMPCFERGVISTSPPRAWSASALYPRDAGFSNGGANFAPVSGLQGQTATGAEPSPATYIGPGEEPEAKEDEVSDIRSDDRTWVEAVDHYVAGVRRERPRRSPERSLRAGERPGAGGDHVTGCDRGDRQRAARGQAQPLQRSGGEGDRDDLPDQDVRHAPVEHPRRQRRRRDLRLPLERGPGALHPGQQPEERARIRVRDRRRRGRASSRRRIRPHGRSRPTRRESRRA